MSYSFFVRIKKWHFTTGAHANIRNNEDKLPYELAKDPETAALLRSAGRNELFLIAGGGWGGVSMVLAMLYPFIGLDPVDWFETWVNINIGAIYCTW